MTALPRVLGYDRAPVLQIVKTALAATIAWALASAALSHPTPFLAALAALLTVQPSVNQSLTRGLERIGGVVLGVLVAYFVGRFFGVDALSVGLMMLIALFVGWLLRLSPQAAVQVPVSTLLVVSIGVSTPGYAWDRVTETLLGAVVGVTINALLRPPAYLGPARQAIDDVTAETAGLLCRVAIGLREPEPGVAARQWLPDARALTGLCDTAKKAVDTADESLRWNPARHGHEALLETERRLLTTLTRVSVQVRGIVRTLHDHLALAPLTPLTLKVLADLLDATAEDLLTLTELSGSAPIPGWREADSGGLTTARRQLRAEVRDDPSDAWLVIGSVLEDVRRIRAEVSDAATGQPVI